jgi:separase
MFYYLFLKPSFIDHSSLQALKPLKLCCRASWKCVKLLSEMSMQKSEGFVGDLSEDAILDFVTEACNQTVFLLDVLHKSGSLKVKKIIVNSLENWSVAEDLFRRLSGPVPLVKQWVKVASARFQLSSVRFFFLFFGCLNIV